MNKLNEKKLKSLKVASKQITACIAELTWLNHCYSCSKELLLTYVEDKKLFKCKLVAGDMIKHHKKMSKLNFKLDRILCNAYLEPAYVKLIRDSLIELGLNHH